MARDNDYFIYGLWSYLWKWIINQGIIAGKIVTFSDNRLSYGKVYGLMGFKKVGEVNPDYYWVKDGVRYHKSALRKTTQEKATGKTEDVLRREQGYLKVWDRGKIKWSIDI